MSHIAHENPEWDFLGNFDQGDDYDKKVAGLIEEQLHDAVLLRNDVVYERTFPILFLFFFACSLNLVRPPY